MHTRDDATLSLVAFGSCRKQRREQPIWRSIARLKPDAFFWLGDAVYGKSPATPSDLSDYYASAAASEGLLRDAVPIVDGVYDDHDYGVNDGGRHFVHREEARKLFLDFLKVPADSPRRVQAGGLYAARTFGTPPRQVKLILLDTRYARDDHLVPSPGGSSWLPKPGYIAGILRALCATLGAGKAFEGDLLGSEEQWRWLEAELSNSSAAVHLIVSSVQVLTSSPIVESWGHFPRSKRRLLNMLADTRPAGAMLLSGDVHYAELLGSREEGVDARGAGMLEITSSGLTHSCGDSGLGKLLCGTILRLFGGHRYVLPPSVLPPSAPSSTAATGDASAAYKLQVGASLGARNFGTMAFEWDAEPMPRMVVSLHDVDGVARLTHAHPLGLSADAEAARWRRALEMPSIFEGAGVLRAPLAAALLVAGMTATVLLQFRTASSTSRSRRGAGRGRKPKGKRE